MTHLEKNQSAKSNSILKWLAFHVTVLLSTGCLAAASNTAPLKPSGLAAQATSSSQISLSFVDNSNDEQGFVIIRSLNSSTGFSQIATLAANVVSFSDAGLSASTPYYYRVAAFKKVKGKTIFSAYSDLAWDTTLAPTTPPPPPPPTPAPTPAPTTDPSWVSCASENAICSFTGTRQVRYGANGIYNYKTATGSITCDNATFGDPLPGVVKSCDYSTTAASATPTPTPAPAPSATPTPAPAPAPAPASGAWTQMLNTKIRSVLPNPLPAGDPAGITAAWGGATIDTKRNRMIVTGGGHADYWGNELYAYDAVAGKMLRLTDPSPYANQATCTAALPDGQPTSRHTYGGLAYIAHADKLFMFSGSLAPCGNGGGGAWTFDFATQTWKLMQAVIPIAGYGATSNYDPITKLVYIRDGQGFWSYNLELNQFTQISSAFAGYHLSSTIDTKRRKMVVVGDVNYIAYGQPMGQGVSLIDLATGVMTTLNTTGGDAVINAASPGVSYDPVLDRVIGWNGYGDLYSLNLDTGVWTKSTPANGPTAAATTAGTFGRFGYMPGLGLHVLVNSIDQDVFVYKPQ